MSELKAFVARKIDDGTCDPVPCVEVYTKSEAGKVIADKDTEIAELNDKLQAANEQIENLINSASSIMLFQDRVNDNKSAELRHQKYKRCLAMVEGCGNACDKWMMRKAKAIGLGKDGVEEYHRARRKLFHYMRWQNRWMKLAEKFKEAK